MSAKARSLLKKLRAKKTEEEGGNTSTQNIEENKKDDLQLPPVKISKNSHSVPKEIIKKVEEPFIDPLDYFKTEHIIIKESTMEEYGAANIRKEIEKEEKKEKDAEGSKKIGGMIGRGFKINFDEMMKARSKVKKEALPEKKSMSVGTRNLKNQNASKFEYVRKNRRNKEDNLYIKLILAKNKFNLGTGLYKQLTNKFLNMGFTSFSDLCSDDFMEFKQDKENAITDGEKKYKKYITKILEKIKKVERYVNEYKRKEDKVIRDLDSIYTDAEAEAEEIKKV